MKDSFYSNQMERILPERQDAADIKEASIKKLMDAARRAIREKRALGESEQIQLFSMYHEAETSSYKKAEIEDLLIGCNIGLLYSVVGCQTCWHLREYISAGFEGLRSSVRNFDIKRGVPFAAYAAECIKGRVFQYKDQNPRRTIRLPVSLVYKERFLTKREKNGTITEEERAMLQNFRLHIEGTRVTHYDTEVMEEIAPDNDDDAFSNERPLTYDDVRAAPGEVSADPLAVLLRKEASETILKIVQTLPPLERGVITLWMNGKTLEEIGVQYGITRQWANLIKKRALQCLTILGRKEYLRDVLDALMRR